MDERIAEVDIDLHKLEEALQKFLKFVKSERFNQLSKWGLDDPEEMSNEVFFRVLIEEVLEVEEAYKAGQEIELATELIQVATVVFAWLDCRGFLERFEVGS